MSEWIPFQTVYINSTPGTPGVSGTGSNFSAFLFGSPIIPIPGRAVKAAVTTATIPLTYYGINSTNDVVNITEDDGVTPLSFDVQLIPGQYTSASVVTMINNAFTAASLASGYSLTYNSTLSTDNGRITFSTSTASYTVTINLNAVTTTAFVPLGLPTYAANGNTNPSFTSVAPYTAPNIINIVGPTEFHIRCGNFLANIYETRVQAEAPILAIVPIVGTQFDLLQYVPAYPKLFGVIGSRLDRLDFLITDQNGLIVDLNNFGVQIQLALFDTPLTR